MLLVAASADMSDITLSTADTDEIDLYANETDLYTC